MSIKFAIIPSTKTGPCESFVEANSHYSSASERCPLRNMTEYISFTASIILEWLKISSNVLLAMGNKQLTTLKLQNFTAHGN